MMLDCANSVTSVLDDVIEMGIYMHIYCPPVFWHYKYSNVMRNYNSLYINKILVELCHGFSRSYQFHNFGSIMLICIY